MKIESFLPKLDGMVLFSKFDFTNLVSFPS